MGLDVPSNEFIYVMDRTCNLSMWCFPAIHREFLVFI